MRVDCDLDFAVPAAQWSEEALKRFNESVRGTHTPRISIVESTPRSVPNEPIAHHFAAEVLANQRITGRRSSKDVRHIEFAIDGSVLPYEPGDGLAVLPRNPQPTVEAVLSALSASGEELITGAAEPRRLTDVLTHDVELTLLSRQFLTAYQTRQPHPSLATLLSPDQAESFAAYLSTHQIVDVLLEAPGTWRPDEFIQLLRPLARRTYSVASSRAATPDEAHLLVAVVQDPHGAQGARYGAASNYLADQATDSIVELHLEANQNFRLPADSDTPIIMIGPGTGVAPFRAFVAERAATGARGRNWLLFGERTLREDFLYQIEWQKALSSGTLHRLDVAFSRDQVAKFYVQDRIREHAREVYAWLEEGATVYVCGDAKQMAKDVHAALHAAIETAAGVDPEAAREYMRELQRNGRYRRDVY
ncbi:MAG: diflavin oxidoreductase, partial [Gammaproteobacteria bacterium]